MQSSRREVFLRRGCRCVYRDGCWFRRFALCHLHRRYWQENRISDLSSKILNTRDHGVRRYYGRFDQLWRAVDRYLAAEAFGTSPIYLHGQEEAIYYQTYLRFANNFEQRQQVENPRASRALPRPLSPNIE